MVRESTILLVDDDPDVLTAGHLLLKRHFRTILTLDNPSDIPATLRSTVTDAILIDMNFRPGDSSGRDGLMWIDSILEMDPHACIIAITALGGLDMAVAAMKHGASDFVAKPWQNEKLVASVDSAVSLSQSRRRAEKLEHQSHELVRANVGAGELIGASAPMQAVKSVITRVGPTDANILILGENGTGKELAARALHLASVRADKVFLSLDLGSLSDSLFESELFGHKKGAFTGANSDRAGRFIAADGGTLFLDEVGNLPLHLQAKLLTALEQPSVTPLGSDKGFTFDVRLIAATNMPSERLYDERYFRQDLLFRLKTVELNMPPLRERGEDIIELTHHYLRRFEKKYHKTQKALDPDLASSLRHYHWPGNVRELRHLAERAVIMSGGQSYSAVDFAFQTPLSRPVGEAVEGPAGAGGPDPDLNLERLEQQAVEAALKRHGYNISRAAKDLGLTRAALYRRMEKHAL